MHLSIDAQADQLLHRHRPGQSLLLNIVTSYALPTEALTVEWCGPGEVAHDSDLVLVAAECDVPVYAFPRLAAYARWHQLQLTTQGPGWWPSLAIRHADRVLHDLACWERSHPGLALLQPAPAA